MPTTKPLEQELTDFAEVLKNEGLEHSDKPFELRAGGVSHWILDTARAVSSGDNLKTAGRLLVAKASVLKPGFELVAGMGICGRALAYGMQYAGCETGFKFDVVEANDDESPNQRYGYGLHGSDVQDKEVLLVDDVGSTGSSLLKLLDMVLDEGGIVHNGLVLTDRSGGKIREALAQRDVDLVAVYEMREFVEIKPALP